MRNFVTYRKAHRSLNVYFGPLGMGDRCLGNRLSTVCQEIQIIEDQQLRPPSRILAAQTVFCRSAFPGMGKHVGVHVRRTMLKPWIQVFTSNAAIVSITSDVS